MKNLKLVALILLIIGGLNWGLVGLLQINAVDQIFGMGSMLSTIIYALVGVAALYAITLIKPMCCGPCPTEKSK